MFLYELDKSAKRLEPTANQRQELAQVLGTWTSLEPCEFGCGGKIVRSGECSNHCPPSRMTTASESFADYSGFSEAFPIRDPRIFSHNVRQLQLVTKRAFKIA